MAKSAMIRARVEETLKADVEKIFYELGLTTTEAVTLFYRQIKLNRGLPFSVKIPNEMTDQTMKEVDIKKNIFKAKSISDLFNVLDK